MMMIIKEKLKDELKDIIIYSKRNDLYTELAEKTINLLNLQNQGFIEMLKQLKSEDDIKKCIEILEVKKYE